jgi:hypothetical protein
LEDPIDLIEGDVGIGVDDKVQHGDEMERMNEGGKCSWFVPELAEGRMRTRKIAYVSVHADPMTSWMFVPLRATRVRRRP